MVGWKKGRLRELLPLSVGEYDVILLGDVYISDLLKVEAAISASFPFVNCLCEIVPVIHCCSTKNNREKRFLKMGSGNTLITVSANCAKGSNIYPEEV